MSARQPLCVFIFTILSLLLPLVHAAVPDWTPPLSTRGRYIVDATGSRFKLKSGNWHGASGTWLGTGDQNSDANSHYGENSHNIPLGLQYVPIDQILDSFELLGINSIRLPFSNQMIHETAPILDYQVQANPQLKGMTVLQVYDAVVKALTDRKFAVILNNHTNKSKWCCGVSDGNERWNESQTAQQWGDDWVFMAKRYKDNPRVVGADLYNEVRRDVMVDPNWGWGNDVDWYAAAQYAGDRVLTEGNSNLLIIIEGINWIGLPVDGLPHGRPTLSGAYYLSHTLMQSHKLVYSAHFYGYTGPNHSGAIGVGETHDPRYRDMSPADLANIINTSAAYVAGQDQMHFTAPIWLSEFGVEGRGIVSSAEVNFFDNFLGYLKQNDLDFAIWPLVGFLENGQGNGWALMNWDRTTGHRDGLYDGNDWRADRWTGLINSWSLSGPVANSTEWNMLSINQGDYVKSATLLARGDFDWGNRKAACPDDQRLIGLSRSLNRGLCTDATYGSELWNSARDTVVVRDQSYVSNDWASRYTKLQCPPNHYVIGYSLKGAGLSSLVCAASQRPGGLGTAGRAMWFDRADSRGDGAVGGEWAMGDFKGQCSGNEYIAGVAFTTYKNPGQPAALYCQSAFRTGSAAGQKSQLPTRAAALLITILMASLSLL